MSVLIKIKVDQEDGLEIEHHPETCTDDDIDSMCFWIKRLLREAYGRAPGNPGPQA